MLSLLPTRRAERTGRAESVGPAPRVDRPGGSAGAGRVAWLDLARGFAVVAVVLMHVGIYQYLPLTQGADGTAAGFWVWVSTILEDLRMPTLLVVSGWLAATQVRAGLGNPKTRRRLASYAYLYVLWLFIYAGLAVALNATEMAQAVAPETIPVQLLMPYSTLWFLAALVWYVAILAAAHRLPAPVVLVGVLAVSAAATEFLSTDQGLWVKVPQLAIYFALGVYGRDAWTAIAERPGLSFFGGGALALVTAIMGQTMVGLEAWSGWVLVADFLTCLGSVAAMLGAACAITRYGGRLARAGAWVGRHTAGIYILHYPALMVLTVVAGGPLHDWPRALLATEAGRWAYPLLTTAIIVGAALLIEVAAERTGMGWLFRMPRRGRRPAQRGPAYRSRNAVSVP